MVLYHQWQLSYVYLVVLSLSFHNNDWHSCSITVVTSVPSLLSQSYHNYWYDCDNRSGTTVTTTVVRLWQQASVLFIKQVDQFFYYLYFSLTLLVIVHSESWLLYMNKNMDNNCWIYPRNCVLWLILNM